MDWMWGVKSREAGMNPECVFDHLDECRCHLGAGET